MFTDGFHAASELRHEDRHSHSVLSTQLITFLYQRDGHYLSQRRRVIQSGKHGEPQSISWSPAFQGPFRISEHLEPLSNTWQSQVQRLRQTQVNGLDGALHFWGKAAKNVPAEAGDAEERVSLPATARRMSNIRQQASLAWEDRSRGVRRAHVPARCVCRRTDSA